MKRQTIVLVEDNLYVRSFLAQALALLEVNVVECGNVSSAIRFLEQQLPDLVITDCNLPGESGADLIRAMAERKWIVPVIGISAEHFRGMEMIKAGAEQFLEKPIEMETLHEVVRKVLGIS